jgi:SAM-dependent methyltransferase
MGISEATGKEGPPGPETRRQVPDRSEDPCGKLSGLFHAPEEGDPWLLRGLLEGCLSRDGIEHQRLAGVTVRALKTRADLRPLLDAAATGGAPGLAEALDTGAGRSALLEPLLLLALTRMILPDLEMERFLTVLRRLALERSVAPESGPGSLPGSPFPSPPPPTELLVALARQCFLTGYVYATSETERRLVRELETRLEEDLHAGPGLDMEAQQARIAVLASYRPLPEWRGAAELARWAEASGQSPLMELIRQQILEPREEEDLKNGIPTRGEIRGRVSEEVRAHYEENPYPRWISVDRGIPRPVAAVIGELFPGLELEGLDRMTQPRILVAGCGTGQHLLQLHYRFRGARIHGVDLSLSSLAFARRKIREHGAEGITLEQADILSLAGWEERFDIVESVGVLQHLADPGQGWRILRDLLEPRGLMKIGVYSARARAKIKEARAYLGERGFGPSEEEVRQARTDLARRFQGDPDADFLTARDFFSMQECRDLLFHAQEHLFTLPHVREILSALALEFLGFEHADPGTRATFRLEHPDPETERDLDAWHDFETNNPRAFRNLYQLWLRAI